MFAIFAIRSKFSAASSRITGVDSGAVRPPFIRSEKAPAPIECMLAAALETALRDSTLGDNSSWSIVFNSSRSIHVSAMMHDIEGKTKAV